VELQFDKSFLKSLDKLNDKRLFEKVEKIITYCESVERISEIKNLKKLSGFSNYYRIKLGSFRIGVELVNKNVLRFIVISHRKDIYRKFPK